jgi:23S rRNA pseudouridine1911/1915/1917 synthase
MTRTRSSGNMLGPIDRSDDYSRSASRADGQKGEAAASALGPPAGEAALKSEDAPRVALVPAEMAGERLDKVLAKVFPEYSRSRLQSWTESGRVLLNGAPAKVRQSVPLDGRIELTPDALPEQLAFTPEPVPLDVVYEDATLVVIAKRAGLVVHPAAGNWSGTILNGLLYRYPDTAGLPRAGIVY